MGFIEFYALAFVFYGLVWFFSVMGLAKFFKRQLPPKKLWFATIVSFAGTLLISGLFVWNEFFPDGQYQDPGVGAGIFLTLFSLSAGGTIMFMIVRKSVLNTVNAFKSVGVFLLIQFLAAIVFIAGLVVISP